ncbi:putative Myb transcription factor [Chloropicon primus]|uniref:Putative Myb transcription factor n=2 Tax=Chloropicon primus TaxID=1764295 RepID=A0A5B8MVK0_9CHLO|nr:putative Myb transcription factor [Chloropicon primus]UPR03781.1 putative Myb transcription factor [Chloropicon primus]|eukprot:QDZ24573.1 putative Myb transcription factor [Chloropicon primus]
MEVPEAEALRSLLVTNRSLQAHLSRVLELVRKQKEENGMTLRKIDALRKRMEYKEHRALGLEVVYHKEMETMFYPVNESGRSVEVPPSRYFVSCNGTVPKPNEDTVKLAEYTMSMPIPFNPMAYRWTERETKELVNVVRSEVVRMKMCGKEMVSQSHKAKHQVEEEETEENLLRNYRTQYQEVYQLTTLVSEEDRRHVDNLDWDKVGKRVNELTKGVTKGVDGARGRGPQECLWQWTYHADPAIPSAEFTNAQGDRLIKIAKDHEVRNWEAVAREYEETMDRRGAGSSGTGANRKRPVDCLQYYQKNRKRRPTAASWTKEEDALLTAAVKGEEIMDGERWNMWSRIAASFPEKTGKQCLQRWNVLVKETQQQPDGSGAKGKKKPQSQTQLGAGSTGRKASNKWTEEEDEILLKKVAEEGRKWSKVAKFIDNKSDRQCRERYTLIDPDLKKGDWTDDEAIDLHKSVVDCYNRNGGSIKWETVGRKMQRCTNHCRKNWSRVVNLLFTWILKETVREMASEALSEAKHAL